MAAQEGVAILGIFVADLAFRAGRLPKIGETIAGPQSAGANAESRPWFAPSRT